MGTKGLRNGAIVTFFVSMGILLVGGHFAKDKVPPIPEQGRQRRDRSDRPRGHPPRAGRLPALRADGPRQRLGARVAARHGFLGRHAALHRRSWCSSIIASRGQAGRGRLQGLAAEAAAGIG